MAGPRSAVTEAWNATVPGRIRGQSLADGTLYVSTEGELYAFDTDDGE